MHYATPVLPDPDVAPRRSRRVAAKLTTIRSQILVAFLAMSLITGALGGYAASNIRYAGVLVARPSTSL